MQYIVSTVTELPFWDSWAESIELKTSSGFFSFNIDDYPGGIYCGIAKNGITTSVSEIKYGFYIESNKFAISENGSLKSPLAEFDIGSTFKISVKDSSVVLLVNEVEVFSFLVNWFTTNQSYRLYFGGYRYGDSVVNAAHGFEQTEAEISSLSYLPVSAISCDNQDLSFICSETTGPVCTSRCCGTAFVGAKTYIPSCNIVTDNESVASISSSVPLPNANLISIRIPFVSYVNTYTQPLYSYLYATTPARISASAIQAESIVFVGEGETDFTAIISGKSTLPKSSIITNDSAWIYSSTPGPESQILTSNIVSDFDAIISGSIYFDATLISDEADIAIIESSCDAWSATIVSSGTSDDIDASINSYAEIAVASVSAGESCWVLNSVYPAEALATVGGLDTLWISRVSSESVLPESMVITFDPVGESAWVFASTMGAAAILSTDDIEAQDYATISSRAKIPHAVIVSGESSWVSAECPMALAEALAVGVDGSSMAIINGESSSPVSTAECSESAWVMADSAPMLGILETGSIDDRWLASVSSQTGGAAGELLGGSSQWVSAWTTTPVSRLSCGAIANELNAISAHTILAISSITAETSTSILSVTAQPEGLIISEGPPNYPAIIIAELPQIFSFARTQTDSFFYSTITLPLLRMECLGLGLISGKIFEIDSSKSKIVVSTIRGAKVGTEDKGMVDKFAISISEDSAIYAGSAIIEGAAISISGEIESLASPAYIRAHSILDVSGSMLAGASMKFSKPLHIYGELNSSSDVHATIEMREEEGALSISGNMYGPKYELAYIYGDRLFSIDGTVSSEIVSASIIAALTIISEESVLVNASRISATIDIALAMESAIDGYLSSLGVSSTVTTSSRAQKIIAMSGKVLASTFRSQR